MRGRGSAARRAGGAIAAAFLFAGCRAEQARVDEPAAVSRTSSAAAQRDCGPPVIDSAGVGGLRIGAPVDSVKARCTVLRDTTERRAEGMPARLLAVRVGTDTLEAEVADGRVWRIEVTQRGVRTADSLGVGSPLAALLGIPGLRGAVGEGALYVMSPSRCGLSFQLSTAELRADGWSAERLRTLPPSTVVTRVLVVGCPVRD
ncbi:MAG TPA: hypothetical protein VFN38_12350 [Gemmatimonadaceae bacterium]|nr:hypothetical protein [Gemmatimonadaceae bacterium]